MISIIHGKKFLPTFYLTQWKRHKEGRTHSSDFTRPGLHDLPVFEDTVACAPPFPVLHELAHHTSTFDRASHHMLVGKTAAVKQS